MKTLVTLFIAMITGASANAVNWDTAWLSGSLGRGNPFFAPGEEMVLYMIIVVEVLFL